MNYKHIFFDCDSTLLQTETLNDLAEKKGVGAEVTDLTERSMNGELPIEEVMPRKMDLIAPHARDIVELYKGLDEFVTEGAHELFALLKDAGASVYILTNNFLPVVEPVAERLGIPKEHIFANTMFQSEDGAYLGIDRNGLLGTSRGKVETLREFKKHHEGEIVHVGDSVSDLDCKEVADRFIGFGGVVVRKRVEEEAEHFVYENNLLALRQYLQI